MRYIENDKLIYRAQDEKSQNCKHQTVESKPIEGTIYRYCKHCGMLAHADYDYSYLCGGKWCKCTQ